MWSVWGQSENEDCWRTRDCSKPHWSCGRLIQKVTAWPHPWRWETRSCPSWCSCKVPFAILPIFPTPEWKSRWRYHQMSQAPEITITLGLVPPAAIQSCRKSYRDPTCHKKLCELLERYRKNWRHRSNLQELKTFSRRKVINFRAPSFGRLEDITCKLSLIEIGTNAKQYLIHTIKHILNIH